MPKLSMDKDGTLTIDDRAPGEEAFDVTVDLLECEEELDAFRMFVADSGLDTTRSLHCLLWCLDLLKDEYTHEDFFNGVMQAIKLANHIESAMKHNEALDDERNSSGC